jgi:ABC-type lipoprotein release transport system permease subunit
MFKLAWRNIWRNRRRAVITIASVFFAVLFCVLMLSFQTGVWERMVDNTLRTQTGHIQIHDKAYWDDKVIDNFMFMDAATLSKLESINGVENVSPRVETFAMAAAGTVSKGIAIIGVSPEKEAQKSNLASRVVEGRYLSETDEGILIGEGLAKFLYVGVGDTIALIGQGYHGSSAAGLFPIRGILKLMTAEMEYSMAYITLSAAQYFIDMPDGYSGVLISIKDNKRLDEMVEVVSSQLSVVSEEIENQPSPTANYAVYSWHFTMEKLLQTAESDKAFGILILFILYVIVGFGILGTVIMLTNERKREFSVMISLGMARLKLASVISIEILIMSLIGAVLAIAVTLPVSHWFAKHPIEITGGVADMYNQYGMEPVLPMSVEPAIFTDQMLTVLFIVLLTIVYPVSKILKMKITK